MGLALLAIAFSNAACNRGPKASELKEWTPADHDRAEEEGRSAESASNQPNSQAPQPAQDRSPRRKEDASAEPARNLAGLAEITWQQKCATCHGPMGHGDGPTGPMVKAPDLTRDDWQTKVTDEEIAMTIRSGKGKMPKFDLPDSVINGIVVRIRASRGH